MTQAAVTKPTKTTTGDARLVRIAVDLRREVLAAENQYQAAVHHAISAGELLNEAHALVPRGAWGAWLAANFEASQTVAATYMRLARHRTEIADARTITVAVGLLTPASSGSNNDERNHEADPMAGYRRTSSAVARALTHAGDWKPEGDVPPGYLPISELRGRVERLLEIVQRWEQPPAPPRSPRRRK